MAYVKKGYRYGPVPELAERNARFEELYKSGLTLQQIGTKYGITRERVRQVLTKYQRVGRFDGGQHKRASEKAERTKRRRDARYVEKYGYTLAEYKALPRKARAAFRSQANNAAHRGIGWQLTLREWWEFWESSGKWPRRGRGNGYVMCRVADTGPYAIGNIYIATGCENSSEGQRGRKKYDLPIGVEFRDRNRFCKFVAKRCIDGKTKHLGSFQTPELAHRAYLNAAPAIEYEEAS